MGLSTESVAELQQELERLRREVARLHGHESHGREANGRLANGVAHHVNNLLTVIMGNVAMLTTVSREDADDAARLDRIRHAVEQGARLTDKLLSIARGHVLEREAIALNALVEETVHLLGHRFVAPVTLEVRLGSDLPAVLGDRTQLAQSIVNLLLNAIEALPEGGTVRVTTRRTWGEDLARLSEYPPTGEFVVLEVEDTGVGMSATTLDRAFEPFFTTKDPSRWPGLGLAVVHGNVLQSGGHVFLDSEPGHGTRVALLLPALAGAGTGAAGTA